MRHADIWLAVLLVALVAVMVNSAHGQAPSADLLLARCMVGEAGWTAEDDHSAIAYVLIRRHRRVSKRYPAVTLSMQIRGYCMALNSDRRWLRELGPELRPKHWPTHRADWAKHLPLWRAVRARASSAIAGTLRDSCPGAWHWAGRRGVDKLHKGRPVLCDWGKNRFQGARQGKGES